MTCKTVRRHRISNQARARMLELYASDMPTKDIADRFCVSELYVRKLASRKGVRKGQPIPVPVPPSAPQLNPFGSHLVDYKRARRGFYLPPALEPAYAELLASGLSLRAAAVRLGVKP